MRSKRFEALAKRPVNQDGFVKEWIEEGETFVGQVVHQRLPAAVRVAAAQQSADQTVHLGRGKPYPLLVQ